MTSPLFSIPTDEGLRHSVSIRDIILFTGSLFLIRKNVAEIHEMFSEDDGKEQETAGKMAKVIMQIVLVGLVFSADSILTAIGLVEEV